MYVYPINWARPRHPHNQRPDHICQVYIIMWVCVQDHFAFLQEYCSQSGKVYKKISMYCEEDCLQEYVQYMYLCIQ